MKEALTAGRLREVLHYDPETGAFMWGKKSSPYSHVPAGSITGSPDNKGYLIIHVDGFCRKAHRLAWLYMTGEWPKHQIDHINGDKADNCWRNLREATHSQNRAHSRVQSTSTSGVKGAFKKSKSSRKWWSGIAIRGKWHHLGSFDTREDAALAYATAAYGVHGEFAKPHWRDLLAGIRGVVT